MNKENANWDLIQKYGQSIIRSAEKYAENILSGVKDELSEEDYVDAKDTLINTFLEGSNTAKDAIEKITGKPIFGSPRCSAENNDQISFK